MAHVGEKRALGPVGLLGLISGLDKFDGALSNHLFELPFSFASES